MCIIISKSLRSTRVNSPNNCVYSIKRFPEHIFEVMCGSSSIPLPNEHIPSIVICYLTSTMDGVVSPSL